MTAKALSDLDADTVARLRAHRFDEDTFTKLAERLQSPGGLEADNFVRGRLEGPRAGDVPSIPAVGSPARKALADRGARAIAAGEVGVVFLAGGMATRFGGVVKAAVPVFDGKTFLDLKLADVRVSAESLGGTVPVYVMTSFATHADVTRLAEAATSARVPVEAFTQYVSLRLTPEGAPFLENGRPSLYAPGHGDLTFALRASGLLDRFRQAGGRVLLLSNVDNATATLDPAIVGAHLEAGRALTVEVVDKEKGDKGGAPARVDDSLQIVESFRFPPSFDQDSIPVFNTNTILLDAAAIDRDFPLTWFAVKKTIDGRTAIQFERLVGELTAFLPTAFLRVERNGLDGRFQPVKEPDDLPRRAPEIRAILQARGVVAAPQT